MLTPFGKEVRKLRIDKSLSLKAMAEGMGVSSAFLSSVETGKKQIPAGFVDKASKFLQVSGDEKSALLHAAHESITTFNINVSNEGEAARETVAMFARNFSTLSEEDLMKIKKVMEESNG